MTAPTTANNARMETASSSKFCSRTVRVVTSAHASEPSTQPMLTTRYGLVRNDDDNNDN